MNKNDEDVKAGWETLETTNINDALYYLRKHEIDVRAYLADCVAAVCDVDTEKMLSNTDVVYLAHARWLYWYAYRYMTNETYEKIAQNTKRINGNSFTKQGVATSVNKMSLLIEQEPLWKKRWAIIKRIIKLRDNDEEKENNTIVINVPKELKGRIKIDIKDK